MKSGLYSTFTIQSLQASPNPRPVKTELLLQQDAAAKAERTAREVRGTRRLVASGAAGTNSSSLLSPRRQGCVSSEPVDSALHVIVTQPSPCPTPALSPQIPTSATSQSQVGPWVQLVKSLIPGIIFSLFAFPESSCASSQ